jgi:uncharacterized membrane protein YdjX (TVP38/TMEM64 family)
MRTRVALLLAVLTLLSGGYFSGAAEHVSDQEKLRALLGESGAWGPLLFVFLFAVLEGLGAPGFLFILAATFVWPYWPAFALSFVGAVGASVVGFVFARYLGRDLLQRYLPARARRYDEQLGERGFQAVVVVRLLFFIAPWAHWMLGLSRVRFLPFLVGTVVGLLPGMLVWTYAGDRGLDWMAEQEIEVLAGVGIGVAAVLALASWRRRRQRLPVVASLD